MESTFLSVAAASAARSNGYSNDFNADTRAAEVASMSSMSKLPRWTPSARMAETIRISCGSYYWCMRMRSS